MIRWILALAIMVLIVYGVWQGLGMDEHMSMKIEASNADLPLSNVVQSVPVDLDTKYPTAFYDELDNQTFTKTISNMFPFSCDLDREFKERQEWTKDIPLFEETSHDILLAYETIMKDLEHRIVSSNELIGPADHTNTLQMVYHRLLSHRFKIKEPAKYMFHVEFVLYRDGKSHGKHYTALIYTSDIHKPMDYRVVQLKFVGVVFEDQIGFFPVEGVQELQPTLHPVLKGNQQ